jgi:hypothetical protein
VRERLDALREAGVTTLIAAPMSAGVDDATAQLRLLAEAAGQAATPGQPAAPTG